MPQHKARVCGCVTAEQPRPPSPRLSPGLLSVGDDWATAAAALRQVSRSSSGPSPATSIQQVCPPFSSLPAVRNRAALKPLTYLLSPSRFASPSSTRRLNVSHLAICNRTWSNCKCIRELCLLTSIFFSVYTRVLYWVRPWSQAANARVVRRPLCVSLAWDWSLCS